VKSWTDEPVGTVEPTEGWVPTTLCDGSPETPDTLNPCCCKAEVACCTESLLTSGTVVVGGPVDTFTVTAEP
jgi:hypothetical protein